MLEVSENKGTLAVIVSGGSLFFRSSLDRFLDTLPDSIISGINDDFVDHDEMQRALDEQIMSSFPYLGFPDTK